MADREMDATMSPPASRIDLPEAPERLATVHRQGGGIDADRVLDLLRQDFVVLAPSLSADEADGVMHDVADRLGLSDGLKLQAGFAAFRGQVNQRHSVGKYFMSVTPREDYQFITPHSEGSSFINMQLASFYCYENTTDGGETILMNVDESSGQWQKLREQMVRVRPAPRPLTRSEVARARGLYRCDPITDVLRDDDRILQERQSVIPGLTLVDVLAKPQKVHSRILDRPLYAFWDSVGSVDYDCLRAYASLLRQWGLLKEPEGGLELQQMDASAYARRWSSGADYGQFFRCKITSKLAPGDLIIQNNLTWAHSANNWSPDSGTRRVAAAFA